MSRSVRWMLGSIAALTITVAASVLWVHLASEAHLRSFPPPPPFTTSIPDDDDALARGDHLVRTRGCRGCHGDALQGQFMWGYAVAPDLGRLARSVSAAQFEAALRHGIAHDGRAMYNMPSYNFLRLRDADVAEIIAYLRSLPEQAADPSLPAATLPWRIRFDIARGTDQAIAGILHKVPPLRRQGDADARLARGEYIAMTTCNECHGLTLRADSPFDDETAPDLAIVAAYDAAAFDRLMRTGKALGDRELPMMSGVARSRFAHFTDDERRDLYAFLRQIVPPETTD